MITAQLNPRMESAETDRAANKYPWPSALLSAQLTCLPPFELVGSSLPPDHMPARRVHFWNLTGALRKIMAPPVGISGCGSVSFWLINISHHISLSSSSEETTQDERRQMKIELCVVITAVTIPLFSDLNTTNTAKREEAGAPVWVSAAPCSSSAT